MAPPVEGTVQLPPDSTGKIVRTDEETILQTDGTYATVETQRVSTDTTKLEALLERQLLESRKQTALLSLIVAELSGRVTADEVLELTED